MVNATSHVNRKRAGMRPSPRCEASSFAVTLCGHLRDLILDEDCRRLLLSSACIGSNFPAPLQLQTCLYWQFGRRPSSTVPILFTLLIPSTVSILLVLAIRSSPLQYGINLASVANYLYRVDIAYIAKSVVAPLRCRSCLYCHFGRRPSSTVSILLLLPE